MESILDLLGTIISVLGLLGVFVELRSSKQLSEGSFITQLNDSFNNNERIQYLYKKLQMNDTITEDDTTAIVEYLTYFETVYILLKKRVIKMSLIDDLFSYRFSLALNNDTIKRLSLIKFDTEYVNVYCLDKYWNHYRVKMGRKPVSSLKGENPNYEIVTEGNKMKKNEFLIRIAQLDDAEEIHRIMVEVSSSLEDSSLYVCDDLAYVKEQISQTGFAVVACNYEQKIVGSFVIRYPAEAEDNLGLDIDLPDDELGKVVHMESAVVLPEYRGNHLQRKMLAFAETLIDKNKYCHFLATASPSNPASCKTFENSGYTSVLTKEKYGGLIRNIYRKDVIMISSM